MFVTLSGIEFFFPILFKLKLSRLQQGLRIVGDSPTLLLKSIGLNFRIIFKKFNWTTHINLYTYLLFVK